MCVSPDLKSFDCASSSVSSCSVVGGVFERFVCVIFVKYVFVLCLFFLGSNHVSGGNFSGDMRFSGCVTEVVRFCGFSGEIKLFIRLGGW